MFRSILKKSRLFEQHEHPCPSHVTSLSDSVLINLHVIKLAPRIPTGFVGAAPFLGKNSMETPLGRVCSESLSTLGKIFLPGDIPQCGGRDLGAPTRVPNGDREGPKTQQLFET